MKKTFFAILLVANALCGVNSLRAQTVYEPYSFSTYAGSALVVGSTNGPRNQALFNSPSGVAVDRNGDMYVADTGNHTIRKIAGGVVSTLAGLAGVAGSGDGTGSTARFFDPTGVAVDNALNVYVADSGNHTIRKISAAGVVTTLAGMAGLSGSANGTGAVARFNGPRGVSVDSASNIYVADTFNHTIRKVSPGGAVTTLAGFPLSAGSANGTGAEARFALPRGVAVDSSFNVYVADTSNNTIRKVTSGAVVTTLAGAAGMFGSSDGMGAAARFFTPIGIAVDGSGILFVADADNQLLRKIAPSTDVTTLGGAPGSSGSTDGTGGSARFTSPQGAAVDSRGNLYVGDTGNSTIRLGQLPGLAIPINVTSNKTHGGAGEFTIPLPASIECRSGGPNNDYTVVFTFPNTLTSVSGATVSSGTGAVSSSAVGSDAREYIVNLTAVSNAQIITVNLTNVADSAGNSSASVTVSLSVLRGDTTGNGSVNASDVSQAKGVSGQIVTASNFRNDFNVSGSLNASDVGIAKASAGTSLP